MDRSVGKSQRRMALMAGVAATLAAGVGHGGGVAALRSGEGVQPTFLERRKMGQRGGIPMSAQYARKHGRRGARNFSRKAYGRRLRRAHARKAFV